MSCFLWGSFAVVLLAIFLAVAMWLSEAEARKAYLAALERLKADPHNPDLREKALAAGRKWKDAASNIQKTVEELSIMNDINAACARAGSEVTVKPPVATPAPVTARGAAERLAELDGLRAKGLITEQEYQARRAEVIKSV